MAPDPYRYFRLEARELMEQCAQDIVELEKNGAGQEVLQRLLRMAHTLKGAARVVKQHEIAERAHAIEDCLTQLRDAAEVPPALIEALLQHAEAIEGYLAVLQPAEPVVQAAPAMRPEQGGEGPRTVRAELTEMDALLDGVVQAHAQLHGLQAAGGLALEARHLTELLLEQLMPRGRQPAPGAAAPAAMAATARELRQCLARLERRLGSATEQLDRELYQLRQSAEQLRLMPAASLFATLERTARDAARALGKPLTFEVSGGGVRLDAHVLGVVQQALVQIVRNAVAHGLEAAGTRRSAGKPEVGRVSIILARRGGRLVFECEDDGGGIDFAAVRRIARERGLLVLGAAEPGEEGLIALLLRGGISTAGRITEVAGRGIGLDVVRASLEQLGGTVNIRSETGRFTRFELSVPLSFVGLDVLLVAAAETVLAIPLDTVCGTLRLAAEEIIWGPAGGAVRFDGAMLPFAALPWLLYQQPTPPGRSWSALVVAGAVLGVDRLLGTALVVARPLPPFTPASPFVVGAALDAEGNPLLLLDATGLAAAARQAEPLQPAARPAPVLIIDDSLTTRMLEQSILESAGYEVDVAASAEAGLACARGKTYRLFLVDVEMPGMDGFTFVETIRADPVLRDIPAILVTSRAEPEDRARGQAAGANGYIDKSRFDQLELLRMIRAMLGGA